MNARTAPLLAASALFLTATSAFALAPMKALCDGAQETPPNGSAGTGTGLFLIDTATNTLFYYISYSGLGSPELAAHIHGYAPAGVPAGVEHALPTGTPKIGAWNYAEADEADILAGLAYVNIHTSGFGGGEIRGQILADPVTNMVALCNGAAETPPNGSAGQGIGFFTIDTGANTLSYDIRFAGLGASESAAHIHGFAAPGTPAGVVHALPIGGTKTGTWNYAAGQEANILAELAYVNIHSLDFPGGEIRGQIVATSPATDAPVIGGAATAPGLELVVAPNPVRAGRGDVALFYRGVEANEVAVTIHDVSGRLIRDVHRGAASDAGILSWDGKDETGTPVAAGVYFARIESAGRSGTKTITVLK